MVNLQETIAEKELGTKIPAPVLDGGRATAPARHRESTVYTREKLRPFTSGHLVNSVRGLRRLSLRTANRPTIKICGFDFAQAA